MPYTSLVLIEARGKLKKLNSLLGAMRGQGGTALAAGGWRLMATGGHFRSLLEATPYFEPPRREVDRPLQDLHGEELKFVQDQIVTFLKENPASTPVPFTIRRGGGWNPDPEANPARYLAIAAPPKLTGQKLVGSVASRPPFQPWFEIRSLPVWRELTQAVRELAPNGVVYLATDDDEEGEAIAWHLMEVIGELAKRTVDFRRVRYSALTLGAVRDAFVAADKGERVSPGLVAAQQAREKLDRIVGYCCSRAIWALGQMPGGRALSLGRVQLAAMLILLDADERVLQSMPQITWSMELHGDGFEAKWSSNKPLDRSPDVATLPAAVAATPAVVHGYAKEQSDLARFPLYTLSRLQDDGHRMYKMSAQAVLDAGQALYLSSLCSYPRSDSDQVSLPTLKFLQKLGQSAGVTQQASNVVRRQGTREQGAHEAIVPLDSPAAAAWAAILKAEQAGKAAPSLDDVLANRTALGKAAADAVGAATGRGSVFPVLVRLYDLIFRRSMAALMPAARLETITLTLHHEAVPTQDGKPVDFRASHERLVSPGGYSVWRFKTTWPEKGSPLPVFRRGQRVPVTMPAKAVSTSIKAEPRPTIQNLVRKQLEKLGIGRPSSTAGALETLGKRGYVRPAGEGREGMTRFGAFVAGLARHTLRDVVSIETTARMDQAASALRKATGKADAMHVAMLEQFWNDVLFARLRETRFSAWQLGNTSGPGLSLLSGYFPGGKEPSGDAMREALRGISGAGWKADAVLDRQLAEDLPVGRDSFVPGSAWHHWGGIRWMAGENRGDFVPVILVWQPKAGEAMIRVYWAYPCAARLQSQSQTKKDFRRCLMFSLLSDPTRVRRDLSLLVEHFLLPLREVTEPITYLGAWDKLLGAWNRIKRADSQVRLDPNGIMVDMPRHESLTSVWSLPHRVV